MADIRLESLRHVYSRGTPFEKTALDDVSLDIPSGQYVAILGHTGSGKSTLIQHLNGLLAPTSGRVLFDGEDIHRSKEALRDIRFRVGLVFQYPEYQLFEETVYRDIAFGPKNMGLSDREIDEHVRLGARFAGVDESNISEMFALMEKLQFGYIMNSQALWGTYPTVKSLSIAELLHDKHSRFITVIRYLWNGKQKILADYSNPNNQGDKRRR